MKTGTALSIGIVIFALLLAGHGTTAWAQKSSPFCYAGQYYPEEFLLQGQPELWKRYGLAVEHLLFSSGTEGNQALIAGRCKINCGSDSKSVELFNALGDRAVIVGVVQRGDRYATVVRANSKYGSWSDLKGKTVATRLGTGAEQVLRKYFERTKGLSWDDFRWVNLKIEDMGAALKGGSIEAFTAWEPTCAIAEAQGSGRVLRTYGDVSRVPVLLHTTADFVRTNRAEIVRFLAAHLDKADFIRTDPKRAAKVAAQAANQKGYNVSPEVFERVFKRIDFSLDLDEGIVKDVQEAARFLHAEKKIDRIPAIKWDASLLAEAKALRERERRTAK